MFLQEHWLPSQAADTKFESDFRDYKFISTSSDLFVSPEDILKTKGPTWHGTALAWHNSVTNYVTKLPLVSSRFCGIRLFKDNIDILAFTVYLPTSGKDQEYLEEIDLLSHNIQEHCSASSLILIGIDANVSEKSNERRKNAFNKLQETFQLKTILPGTQPTFHHNNGSSESQIDHILTNDKRMVSFYEQRCKYFDSENLSSHDVLVASIKCINIELQRDHESLQYEDFNPAKIVWENNSNYEEMTSNIVLNLLKKYDLPEYLPSLAEMISNSITVCAKKCFAIKHPKKFAGRSTPYFSSELRQAYKSHREICKKWRIAGRPISSEHPAKAAKVQSQRFLQKIRRENDYMKNKDFNDDLMRTYHSDISQIYSKINKCGNVNRQDKISEIETLRGTFTAPNVLDGFRLNTEYLCSEKQNGFFKEEYLQQCEKDLLVINDIIACESRNISPITVNKLQEIVSKLKNNKACDIYHMTAEHLKYAGVKTLELLCVYINRVIQNMEFYSAPEFKLSVASVIYKGKDKPRNHHKSYRLVRVGPLIGRLIDEYIRPQAVKLSNPSQSNNQYGFTENISYLLGALQRHEAQKHCIDSKKTFFGCSLDGDSAFEVVNRSIQVRELFCAGETGQFGIYNKSSYENTQTRIKMDQKLSLPLEEKLGVGQGKIRSSDHYKIYINSILQTLENSNLGVNIGPITVGISCVADDLYLLSDCQIKLQCMLSLCQDYGQNFRIEYGASKTVISIIGSKKDALYYSDIKPWIMDGHPVSVKEDNKHLGLIISNNKEEQKNVDMKLKKCRSSLFKLLGSTFSSRSNLSPVVKTHLFRTYISPIARSGLSAMTLTSIHTNPLTIFHRKVLRGFLGLSDSAPVPSLYFLTGELPFEATLHRDSFMLFHNVWNSPKTKIFEIIDYLLQNCSRDSHTWSRHMMNLATTYGIRNPKEVIRSVPPTKEEYSKYILTKITVHHEKELRQLASRNSKMKFLNIDLKGLNGRPHHLLYNINTTREAIRARSHIKFLCDDVYTFEKRAKYSGGSPTCRLCLGSDDTVEDMVHIIANCSAYGDLRSRILSQMKIACEMEIPAAYLEDLFEDDDLLTQFVLDCTSFNLPKRICPKSDLFLTILDLSRDFCFKIARIRSEGLRLLYL